MAIASRLLNQLRQQEQELKKQEQELSRQEQELDAQIRQLSLENEETLAINVELWNEKCRLSELLSRSEESTPTRRPELAAA